VQPSGPIENTLCAYETIESLNKELYPTLHELVTSDFFRHYKVDLFRECPFWYENGFCMNRDCGVETADEVSSPFGVYRMNLTLLSSSTGSYTRKVAEQGSQSSYSQR
jgi:site-specific DNA-adenine methylase